jgi:hypothetical protein
MHKTTIKKNLIIFHRPGEWSDIYASILKQYGMSMALRTRLRRDLGFTYRHHKGLVPNEHPSSEMRHSMHYEDQIHLDFYSEQAQSWFILRYLNKTGSVEEDTQII